MKKIIAFMMVAAVALMMLASCATQKVGVLDKITNTTLVNNPALAGTTLAKGLYTGYLLVKNNPKYDKETKAIEAMYLELLQAEKADEKPTIGAVNKAALTVLRAAAISKYGYVKGGLIADATNVAGTIIDARIKKRMSETDENVFMDALITELKNCVANSPVMEKELEEECIDCDICERIKRELARDDLTAEERAEYEKMLKQYECGDVGFCGESSE